MNKIILKSAKSFTSRALLQQNLMAQVRLMSLMTQRRVVLQQPMLSRVPIRSFAEDNKEDIYKYLDKK